MRTTIHLNDELVSQALQLSGRTTQRCVVEEALKVYVRMLKQEKIPQLRGILTWEGDLGQSRLDGWYRVDEKKSTHSNSTILR